MAQRFLSLPPVVKDWLIPICHKPVRWRTSRASSFCGLAELRCRCEPKMLYSQKVTEKPLTEDDLIAFARERLADFKCPRKVVFLEEFPRTATGKIQKGKLVEDYLRFLERAE